MLPPKRFSARWWPVAEELKGSKIARVGLAAMPLPLGLGGVMMVVSLCGFLLEELVRFGCECCVG